MWSWASGVMVITYDEVSVAGAAVVSVDARRVLRRAAGALARAAGALDGAKAEAIMLLIARAAASAARRRTICYRSVTAAMTALWRVAGCVTNQYGEAARALRRLDVILPLDTADGARARIARGVRRALQTSRDEGLIQKQNTPALSGPA